MENTGSYFVVIFRLVVTTVERPEELSGQSDFLLACFEMRGTRIQAAVCGLFFGNSNLFVCGCSES